VSAFVYCLIDKEMNYTPGETRALQHQHFDSSNIDCGRLSSSRHRYYPSKILDYKTILSRVTLDGVRIGEWI
jgi:hypothetical protein